MSNREDEVFLLRGLLCSHDFHDEHETLYCGNEGLTEWAMEKIGDAEWVSVRYWISGIEAPDTDVQRQALETIYGSADVEWRVHYSEITGYLWTDDDFIIGGHDMNSELRSYIGKYLLLELTVHTGPKP